MYFKDMYHKSDRNVDVVISVNNIIATGILFVVYTDQSNGDVVGNVMYHSEVFLV